MAVSKEELRYAAYTVIPVVQDVYERYSDGHVTTIAPNVAHLADIEADTRMVEELAASRYPGTNSIVRDMFMQPAANPLIFGAVDFDAATSTLFIAFRGTKKGSEWLDDFEVWPGKFSDVGDPEPWVHLGFLHVWRLGKDSLSHALDRIPAFQNVIVTGHSLGAAIANLCALEISGKIGFGGLRCWTFASPRTYFGVPRRFDETIVESMRVFNPVDIVTQSPSIPFVHVKGGIAIRAKLQDFHSLLCTYQRGIEALLASARGNAIETQPNEADTIEQLSAPDC
jgi:hypothetical protein